MVGNANFFVCYQPKFHKVLLLPQPDVAYS